MGRLLNSKTLRSVKFVGPADQGNVSSPIMSDIDTMSWGRATRDFISQIERFEQAEDELDVKLHPVFNIHLYTEAWAQAVWSHLYEYDELATEWADSTVLLTFSGSYWLDKDSEIFCPPLTFFEQLQRSKSARQRQLSRVLDDIDRWASVRAIGGVGHNGYPRVFVGLYLSDTVSKKRFEPVLQSHVDNCPIAGPGAHTLNNAVSIAESPEHRSRLIHGIGQKVPALSEGGITNESEDRQRMATALHALNSDPYSTAQSR